MATGLTDIIDYLTTQSWQIALLVLAVGALNLALRNRSAHVRYLLWLIVLAKCLVPPFYAVPLAILPGHEQAEPAAMAPPLHMLPQEHEVTDTMMARPAESSPIASQPPAPPAVERGWRSISVHEWLGIGWLVGACVFLMFNLLRALRANLWLWGRRKALPEELRSNIEDLFSAHGVRSFPDVWLVEGFNQPFVWGLFRGSIYLPVNFLKINRPENQKSVLAHELSHVLRFDAAVNILQVVAQAIFWFHPFVWWANRKIRTEREKCCDEMAIAQLNTMPRDYSTAILETLATKHEPTRPVPSLAVAGPVKNVEERIKAMLRPGKKFYRYPSLVTVTVVLLLAFLTVPTALVLTAKAQEKTTTEPSTAKTEEDRATATAALFRALNVGDYRGRIAKDVMLVKSAITQGADLEAKNNWGLTPLHMAVRQSAGPRYEILRLLLQAGANPNARDPKGQIPLHLEARGWHLEPVKLLVSAGSDVNAKDNNGMRPVMMALEDGQTHIFDLLVANGAAVPNELMVAYKGNRTRVQSLIESGKAQETFEQGLTLLHAAAAGGHTSIVQLLLTNGSNVHSQTQAGYTALHYAAGGNHRELAELLLAKGADIDAEAGIQSPLHWAIREQHKDMIEWLVARGANPNAHGGGWATPLHWAIWWSDIDTAALLVSHGGDIHLETQEYPDSSLYDSVWNSSLAMTEALVTNARDERAAKWAPLHTTVVLGNIQEIEELLAEGADVNAKDEDSYTALFIAALRGHEDVVQLLLAKGADINARVDDDERGMGGWTSLHAAARFGRQGVVEILISKGADINARTKKGKTALSLAKDRDHTEIVELLKKHGAKE